MSASLTVTAVNTGTDTLTATAHGMIVGQRFRLRNVGGALPAATPALAAGTTYFAIFVNANDFRVATSVANAIAGTAVDITGAGSGTTFVETGLPYCEPRVAVAGSQVFSADDNATWQALVALWAFFTAQTQTIYTGITLAANQDIAVSGTGKFKHGTRTMIVPIKAPSTDQSAPDVTLGVPSPASAVAYNVPIQLPAGKRITAVRAVIKDSATGPTTLKVGLVSALASGAGGAYTVVGQSSASAGSGAVQTITLSSLTAILASGSVYSIGMFYGTGSAACHLYALELDYDEP